MPVFQLSKELIFPPPELAESDGLLAIGGDLSPERLLKAYRMGIFPWFSQGDPILWWSPAPRAIIEPQRFIVPKRLARSIKQQPFRVSIDTAFEQVIASCARTRRKRASGTWITPAMITAYLQLHELGYAHSVECWQGEELTGGLYGIALGGVFFGESMFQRVSNSSKIALHALVQQLVAWEFVLLDCQVMTDHLVQFGAVEVPRQKFADLLERGLVMPDRKGKWRMGKQ